MEEVVVLSEFLKCNMPDLTANFSHYRGVVWPQSKGDQKPNQITFPECEPCCLKDYRLPISTDSPQQELFELAVFIRLWRKLQAVCGARYTFQQLYDICTVLGLFPSTGTVNPEFIRQLAAFQMLRDYFKLPLVDHTDKSGGTTPADRTHILALWVVGSTAKKWKWAVHQLLEGVEAYAKTRLGCARPRGESIAHMADNLDALSRLAKGFNPPTSTNPSTDTWNSTPGCTLRFAEVLAKISASKFRVNELLYLFNAGKRPHEHEDPFAQDAEDALHFPLDLPEDGHEHSLWKLREDLLRVEVDEEKIHHWTHASHCGFINCENRDLDDIPLSGQDPLLSIGQHFFPGVLESAGYLGQRSATTIPCDAYLYDDVEHAAWKSIPVRLQF